MQSYPDSDPHMADRNLLIHPQVYYFLGFYTQSVLSDRPAELVTTDQSQAWKLTLCSPLTVDTQK